MTDIYILTIAHKRGRNSWGFSSEEKAKQRLSTWLTEAGVTDPDTLAWALSRLDSLLDPEPSLHVPGLGEVYYCIDVCELDSAKPYSQTIPLPEMSK